MNLSKSKYCLLSQCHKLLWLETYHKELKTEDAAGDERMAEGSEVGSLARELFGDFVDVTEMKEDGKPDISAMIENTRKRIEEGVDTICEASFSHEGLYCAADILRKENGGYAIYEVKSSTNKKDIYATDISFQKYVLERCGINVTGTYLICINSSYIRGDDLDIHELFEIQDVSADAAKESIFIAERLALAEQTLSSDKEPVWDIGEYCHKPYDCAYRQYCFRHIPKPSVFDISNINFNKAVKYYKNGKVSFEDIRTEKLNPWQEMQIRCYLDDCGDHIDKSAVSEFLDTLSYPIYFLDFETMQQAIPQYKGTKPYQQIPFQYSLHYLATENGGLKHKEFLAESGKDPRRDIAESLCRDIPEDVCVTAYNKKFECSVIKALAAQFPDLSGHLMNIHDNIKDLMHPFQHGHYYSRAMGKSYSIKCVLPALYPDDPDLDYHNLEGVHNGAEAMTIFPQIKDMTPEKAAEARKNLLEYCKLDTYAMVKVWAALNKAVK